MTREELTQQIAESEKNTRALNKQLAKLEATDRQEANKQLEQIVTAIEGLMEDAINLANKHSLEFCVDWSQGGFEFESADNGNWNTSTC